tara:strand:- start:92 stop:415 length:324 start_codon:yes stop_codon:yes gene_type:complete
MNLNELRKMVKEVLQENAYDDFLKKQGAVKSTKMLPREPRRAAKPAGIPEKEYDSQTDFRISATSDEEARAILKDRVKKRGFAPGRQYLAKDADGYFIRTLVDTRGT